MGNQVSGSPNTWLGTQLQQVPGLIKSTMKNISIPLGEESSNLPIQIMNRPTIEYIEIVTGLDSPVAYVDLDYGPFHYIVDQTGYVYCHNLELASNSTSCHVERGKGIWYTVGEQETKIFQSLLIDLTNLITPLNPMYDERGLLQMTPHPTKKGIFYLYYTVPSKYPNYNCDVILEEWILTNPVHCIARPTRKIIEWPHPEANHFGSPVGFLPDGCLLLATGDGGGAGDKHGSLGNAQNPKSEWGKMFCIYVDEEGEEIPIHLYAMGFRNPWRGSITNTGIPMVGEVGQDDYEGILFAQEGSNHGWKALENGHVFDMPLYAKLMDEEVPLSKPYLWYDRSLGRAVIGGYEIDEGVFLFGDFTGGKEVDNVYVVIDNILYLQPKVNRAKYLHSFGRDSFGNIYGLFNHSMNTSSQKGVIYRMLFNFS